MKGRLGLNCGALRGTLIERMRDQEIQGRTWRAKTRKRYVFRMRAMIDWQVLGNWVREMRRNRLTLKITQRSWEKVR